MWSVHLMMGNSKFASDKIQRGLSFSSLSVNALATVVVVMVTTFARNPGLSRCYSCTLNVSPVTDLSVPVFLSKFFLQLWRPNFDTLEVS